MSSARLQSSYDWSGRYRLQVGGTSSTRTPDQLTSSPTQPGRHWRQPQQAAGCPTACPQPAQCVHSAPTHAACAAGTACTAAQHPPDDEGDLLLPQLLVGNLQGVSLSAHLNHHRRVHANLRVAIHKVGGRGGQYRRLTGGRVGREVAGQAGVGQRRPLSAASLHCS